MKKKLLSLLMLMPCLGLCQNHDHVWMLGYSSAAGHPDFGGVLIDFNSYPPQH